MARIFDRKLAITYRWLQAVVLLGYLLGYKIGFQKVVCARIRTHTLGLRYARAPRVWPVGRWVGWQSGCGRSPGADVAGVSPVPAQMWARVLTAGMIGTAVCRGGRADGRPAESQARRTH